MLLAEVLKENNFERKIYILLKNSNNMRKPHYEEAKEYIFDLLDFGLKENLCYHNLNHTKDVIEVVEVLGWTEHVTDKDILLLKTAAAYHDTGFLVKYKGHEQTGAGIARGSLKRYGYKKKQIESIASMILATQLPQNPNTLLEEILCDADLDNFGREDFFDKGTLIRKELEGQGIKMSDKDWYEGTLKLLENHEYFTESAKELRQNKKADNLAELKKLVGEI